MADTAGNLPCGGRDGEEKAEETNDVVEEETAVTSSSSSAFLAELNLVMMVAFLTLSGDEISRLEDEPEKVVASEERQVRDAVSNLQRRRHRQPENYEAADRRRRFSIPGMAGRCERIRGNAGSINLACLWNSLTIFLRFIHIDPSNNFSMSDTSNQAEPWKDSNHPLFLHHSDQPGAVLVSQPLVEDNYDTWRESMMMALTIKNKAGFVTGKLSKPSNKPTEELQWERCNVLVKTWLLGSMSKEISKSVVHCKTAQGIWLDLKDRFSQSNIVSLFNIEKEIHDCSQGADSVNTYFTKLKSLWDAKDALTGSPKCSCDAADEFKTFLTNQKTMQFLMGLTPAYEHIRSTIIGLDPFPEPNKAYSMVLRQEQQAKISNAKSQPSVDASAFSVKQLRNTLPHTNAKHCDKCNLNNHTTKQCRAHLTCTFCNIKGHTIDYCRKRKKSMDAGPQTSNSHHIASSSNSTTVPQLTPAEYQQVMGLLARLPRPDSHSQQPSDTTNSVYHSSANHVGNPSTYDQFSGPSNEEDDWDGI